MKIWLTEVVRWAPRCGKIPDREERVVKEFLLADSRSSTRLVVPHVSDESKRKVN